MKRGRGLTTSNQRLKRTPIRKKGRKGTLWEDFANKKAERDRDEEGLIDCQCDQVGLEPCGAATPRPDLHHIIGRDERPDLYFDESNLVWLIRSCHNKAHDKKTYNRNTNSTSSKT